MAKKNQMTQANDSSNSIVELLDEDLQQIVGGLHLLVKPIVDELPVEKPPVVGDLL